MDIELTPKSEEIVFQKIKIGNSQVRVLLISDSKKQIDESAFLELLNQEEYKSVLDIIESSKNNIIVIIDSITSLDSLKLLLLSRENNQVKLRILYSLIRKVLPIYGQTYPDAKIIYIFDKGPGLEKSLRHEFRHLEHTTNWFKNNFNRLQFIKENIIIIAEGILGISAATLIITSLIKELASEKDPVKILMHFLGLIITRYLLSLNKPISSTYKKLPQEQAAISAENVLPEIIIVK